MENVFEKKPIELVNDKIDSLNESATTILNKMDCIISDLKEIKEHLKKVDEKPVHVVKPKGWLY